MENFSYHVPFYVVTGGVDLEGHSSELKGGQIGLFDRSTFSVATGTGSGTEFFFAQGNIGGKDWAGYPVTETSHKSPFFLGRDVENIYLSLPKKKRNQEWVIGFNGADSSIGLTYTTGKAIRIKFYFHGQPTYRFFGGPKEYTVSYTPPVGCAAPCTEDDCPDPIADCLVHTQAIINQINEHVELKKFGVQAKLVTSTYVAGTATNTKYCITLCDNGDALALQAVKAQAPTGARVTRTVRSGSLSTYEFCQPDALDAPADFTQTGSVLQAVCETCPDGSTLVAAKDVYIVRRPLAASDDTNDDAARDTYADTVGSAYSVSTDGDKVFLGNDNGQAIIQIKTTAGATVTAQASDNLQFSHTEPASCVFEDPDAIAWTECGVGISSRRKLKINALQRPECDGDGDRLADLESILAGVEGIDLDSLEIIPGVACADDYTVEQNSVDCLPEDCLTSNVTFSYDDLPAFEGKSWEVVPDDVDEDADRKCGIRITMGYEDIRFGNDSFTWNDYQETEPMKLELSLLLEDGEACDYKTLPSVQQTVQGQSSRQTGEWVLQQVVKKTDAYLKHMQQFSMDAREREAFDKNLLNMVDRNAFYNLYYVTFNASYGFRTTWRHSDQEKFTAVFAFKEGDASAKVFETNVLNVLTAKSGVPMHIND